MRKCGTPLRRRKQRRVASGKQKRTIRVWVQPPIPAIVPPVAPVVAARRVWVRDPRDPPERYFQGGSGFLAVTRPEGWHCGYGCPGIVILLEHHTPRHVWNCPYWDREGRTETPF